jgi:hypothetical protein
MYAQLATEPAGTHADRARLRLVNASGWPFVISTSQGRGLWPAADALGRSGAASYREAMGNQGNGRGRSAARRIRSEAGEPPLDRWQASRQETWRVGPRRGHITAVAMGE